MLAAVETAAIGRMFGRKHGHRLDADREFLAIGMANLAAGLGSGMPVSGGMSQSLVNESGGARTPVSGLVASLLVLVVALWFSGLLADLPQPVLAAIVLMAVTSLIKVSALQRLWRAHRSEFYVAMAALVGVLCSGILRGVLIGAIISLALLLRRAARPHVAFLGRIPGMQRFSDLARHPDNEPVPGALLFRAEASLLYFNCESVREAVLARVREAAAPLRFVVCDLSTSPHVDMAGAEMLMGLHRDLEQQGIQFQVVEARAKVRDMLRVEGFEDRVGAVNRFASLAEVVAALSAVRRPRRTSVHLADELALLQRLLVVVFVLLRSLGQLHLLGRHGLVGDLVEDVPDAVEPRALLVVRAQHVPRRVLGVGGVHHHVARV
jgi:MFS superfamily sulfate permease-like transporter